jgi:hypothetical protein
MNLDYYRRCLLTLSKDESDPDKQWIELKQLKYMICEMLRLDPYYTLLVEILQSSKLLD